MQNNANSEPITNEHRIHKLIAERALQVKRSGVAIRIAQDSYQGSVEIHYNNQNRQRLQDLFLQERYSLQICQENGQPICKVFPTQLIAMNNAYFVLNIDLKLDDIDLKQEYYIVKTNASIQTHKAALANSPSSSIADYIEEKTTSVQEPKEPFLFGYQEDLNKSQNAAIKKVGRYALTFIKGPPGCGKTKTIGRLCKLLYLKKQRIIAGAVSNTGNLSILNSIVKQLFPKETQNWIKHFVNIMYLQHFYASFVQMSQQASQYIAPQIVMLTPIQTKAENDQIEPLLRYFSLYNTVLRKIFLLNEDRDLTYTRLAQHLDAINSRTKSYDPLTKKVFSLYKKALSRVLSEAHIVITTTTNIKFLNNYEFKPDVAILDQASQAAWGDTYCYLSYPIKRMVQVGDDKQLDPTVISQDKILKQSVFAKLCHKTFSYFILLDTQYRMHPQISEFPNLFIYENKLKNGVTAEQRMTGIWHFCHYPVSFVNHQASEEFQIQQNGKKNYYNLEEIRIMEALLNLFPLSQIRNVGIITTYNLQVQKISAHFQNYIKHYGLTVKSCDGYQGGQKDFILFSCVRSNMDRKIGFCGQKTRINVSLTRARKGLAVIGSMYTLGLQEEDNIWYNFILFLSQKARVFHAEQIINTYENAIRPMFDLQPRENEEEEDTFANQNLIYLTQQDYISYCAQQQAIMQNCLLANPYQHPQYPIYPVWPSYHSNQEVGVDPFMSVVSQEDKQKHLNQKIEQFFILQTYIEPTKHDDENEQLQSRNKQTLKQIRKIIQRIIKYPEEPSSLRKSQLQQMIQKGLQKNDIFKCITRDLLLQAYKLMKKHKEMAHSSADFDIQIYITGQLVDKSISNHMELNAASITLLRKGLISHLIKAFL